MMKIEGIYSIVDYVSSHSQILLGDEEAAFYIHFSGVSEMKLKKYMSSIIVSIKDGTYIETNFAHLSNFVDYNTVKFFEINSNDFLGYVIACSCTIYQGKGFGVSSINELSKSNYNVLYDTWKAVPRLRSSRFTGLSLPFCAPSTSLPE